MSSGLHLHQSTLPNLAVRRSPVNHSWSFGLSPFARHYSGNPANVQPNAVLCSRIERRSLAGSGTAADCKLALFVSLPLGTEMFHFPRCPSYTYGFSARYPDLPSGWVSPFGNLRIKGCLPPPRSLSQAATSFIGFLCRGIHHLPFVYALTPLKHENVLAEVLYFL